MALRRPTIDNLDSLSLTEIGAKFKYDIEGTIRWCNISLVCLIKAS